MRYQRFAPAFRKRPFHAAAGLLFAAAAGVSLPANAACQLQAMTYDYPEQRLDQALQQFAHTSGCPVEMDNALVEGHRAQAVSGRFTPDAALIQLVRGSGLEVHLDDGHYRVSQSDREHIDSRIETFRYRIGSARGDGTLDPHNADALMTQLDAIEAQSDQLITEQGFLSAAEKASHERFFAWLEGRLAPSNL
ncbi:STN domain-containing protein [Kushneria sp. TE3]|uniref:STN domain-containing protein n=1 Tax=Kushneria sp. TE3 TaxID=3449832 RepID=UPI003F685EB0